MKDKEKEHDLMTLKEVCDYLRISKETLRLWMNSEDKDKMPIPAYKVGGNYRFKREDVESMVVRVN